MFKYYLLVNFTHYFLVKEIRTKHHYSQKQQRALNLIKAAKTTRI